LPTITPHIIVRDAARAADWYAQALGAEVGRRVAFPTGGICRSSCASATRVPAACCLFRNRRRLCCGRIVEIDIVADPERLRELDLTVLSD
jgi:catechol 2,3-dioxygenase-like lactoylglutathione lyase family enzyme